MKTIKLKQGLNIQMAGAAEPRLSATITAPVVKIVPDHYEGITPKVAVKAGDTVKIGTPVLFDKSHPELKIVSPVSGTVKEVARGERRKLLYVSIERNGTEQETLPALDAKTGREQIIKAMLATGFAAMLRQRPYDVIANPDKTPKAIFVSAFDSAPLAQDYNFVLQGEETDIQAGLDILAAIAPTYYSVSPATSASLKSMKGVEINEFEGRHPAGNVGVHINRLNPVNKDEAVWTMNIQDVALMGRYANTGKLDLTRRIAVAGPKIKQPAYIAAVSGTPVSSIIEGNVMNDEHVRIINGNVLTGLKVNEGDVLSPFAGMVTAIAEGDEAWELLGWAMPRFNKFSSTCLYFTKLQRMLCPKKQFEFDARLCGGERAFIMSGEYERVFPMDIMPEQLVKAMIAHNLDRMEQLGAYEVAPEDFALCEFVCTSKIKTQSIVREALNYMRKELE
ncbi:MAG: Na(+)-translocating NADH-quinone reductase subunit A [Candidatus Aphodosoma sp.]